MIPVFKIRKNALEGDRPSMITLETLEKWLLTPAEDEHLEFKEAKQGYDTTKLLRYCVALGNEGHQ